MKSERSVVITGAAGGMGALFVERFLDNGDTVIATDASEDALAALKAERDADALHVVLGDVTRDEDCKAVARHAGKTAGRIDVLVNAAGYFPVQAFEAMSDAYWRRIVDINLTGVALMTQAALPMMKGRGWGRIVNIGSASIYHGVPAQAPYVAAKAGVVGLTRTLAREFGHEGITVNIVAPGLTITPAAEKGLPKELRDSQIAARCLKREQKPEDVVGPTFFLASPDANFITGQTIIVDGGIFMI